MNVAEYRRLVKSPSCPLETDEAKEFMRLCRQAVPAYPDLAFIFHVTNEGTPNIGRGVNMKKEGRLPGYPDYGLDVARGGFHGWRGELKRLRGSTVSPEQKVILARLRAEGYDAEVYRGGAAMFEAVVRYLEGEK